MTHNKNWTNQIKKTLKKLKKANIIFHDPIAERVIRTPKINNQNKLNSNMVSFQPKEGMLVLFPSYLQHSVNVNKTDEERIVISFNINLI